MIRGRAAREIAIERDKGMRTCESCRATGQTYRTTIGGPGGTSVRLCADCIREHQRLAFRIFAEGFDRIEAR